MKYKLVVLDVDGTLLNSQGSLPKRHKQIIQRLQSSGIQIVLATGRLQLEIIIMI